VAIHEAQKGILAGNALLCYAMKMPVVEITLPDWVESFVDWERLYSSDEEKINLAIGLSGQNVLNETGGPFGAAIFDSTNGKLLSVGVNQAVSLNNSSLHAEVVAIMMAQKALDSYTLKIDNVAKYELFTSCEPCCMCVGATLWSGVGRLVCAATKDDASRVGFDEGPVYESSYEYLMSRGIAVERRLQREKAARVFDLYKEKGGIIYNR
jgi:tRNA(Arg) A34 adenosine deaminase TadA